MSSVRESNHNRSLIKKQYIDQRCSKTKGPKKKLKLVFEQSNTWIIYKKQPLMNILLLQRKTSGFYQKTLKTTKKYFE